jgi:hypothetical protein
MHGFRADVVDNRQQVSGTRFEREVAFQIEIGGGKSETADVGPHDLVEAA